MGRVQTGRGCDEQGVQMGVRCGWAEGVDGEGVQMKSRVIPQ